MSDSGPLAGASGTIAATNVSQPLLAADSTRTRQLFQNKGSNRMRINFIAGDANGADAIWADPLRILPIVSPLACTVSGTAGDAYALLISPPS